MLSVFELRSVRPTWKRRQRSPTDEFIHDCARGNLSRVHDTLAFDINARNSKPWVSSF